MDDRGEKIVSLARTMLHSGYEETIDSSAHNKNATFKAFCLTAIIAAFGSSAMTSWASEIYRPITYYEKIELDALLFYAARQNPKNEIRLKEELKAKLELHSPDEMTANDYMRARAWLHSMIK
ncbi:MAG: hypothetical protein PHX43_08485 [Alphaproteobacteria bacterium]|nr:hypothetical protein [Alphaproteobacteria bacterium]